MNKIGGWEEKIRATTAKIKQQNTVKKQQKATKDNSKKRKPQPQHKQKKNTNIKHRRNQNCITTTQTSPKTTKTQVKTPKWTLSQIPEPTGEQRGPRFHPQGGCLAPRQLPKYFGCAPIKTLDIAVLGQFWQIQQIKTVSKRHGFVSPIFILKIWVTSSYE